MEEHLLELYAAGRIDEILQKIFPTPDVSFDLLSSDDPLFPYLLNYLDASFFKTWDQALCACECLAALTLQFPKKQPYYDRAFARLEYEQQTLRSLMTAETAETPNQVPQEHKQLLNNQYVLEQGWSKYQQNKEAHALLLKNADQGFTRPWQAISYEKSETIQPFNFSEATPLIYLEPFRIDYASLLEPLRHRPALFIFETRAKLIQQLQFPAVLECLSMPYHLVYVMEVYPNSQFAMQDFVQFQGKQFEVFSLSDSFKQRFVGSILQQALQECLQQPFSLLTPDTELGNWLYRLSQRMLFELEEERLGVNRVMALHEYVSAKQWHDPHKGQPAVDRPLGPDPIDYQKVKLSMLAEHRDTRIRGKGKIKLVHVVPQIVDGGHAPSRLLENLILHHNREEFELYVISTERLQFHWMEYPYNLYSSEPSDERAPHRIAAFKKHGCDVYICNDIASFERAAVQVSKYIQHVAADVVVFHGPDVVNNMAAQMTDAPLRVMYDHGTLPSYRGYDLVLASTPVLSEKYQKLFSEWGVQERILPFAVDVKSDWLAKPFEMKDWGLPAGSLMMTTISQHLENRLSSEMLLAIAEILQRVPHAYYVPIGKMDHPEAFVAFFQKHQVAERVRFMGQVAQPSQYARSMHLYLNEFPFGSGLGMLDAMASGCPIVSMYDADGPPQARYGGQYMGTDWVIASGKRSDYVDLACRLLTDETLYRMWSQQALLQYEAYANVKGYVQSFEEIVKQESTSLNDTFK